MVEFKIFDENKNSYVIGDLLNMPYFFSYWNNTPHHDDHFYNRFKTTAKQYPNSILGLYDSSRTDESQPIPNVERLKNTVEQYIEMNVNRDPNLNNLLKFVDDENVLCVHLRSGDIGIVDEKFIWKIQSLSEKYKKIIILCGIHQNGALSHYYPSVEESINNMNASLDILRNNVKDTEIIIDTSEPDTHISLMHKAKNLLVHLGGFSIIGTIVFTGNNLYITDLFYPIRYNNSDRIFSVVKNYTII